VPEELFLHGLRQLVGLDREWVPPGDRGALYIRPCLFSTDPSLRVKPPEQCLFVIFTFPFTQYYSGAVDLHANERYVRAFPGGTGEVKPAGNYAAALLAEREARENGFHSVLWLDAREHSFIEECGVMNIFFVIENTVVTPPLAGTILPGITRDSAITVLRDMGLTVVERQISIEEIFTAEKAGTLRECFGTGTAATVSAVRRIGYRDREVVLPQVDGTSISSRLRERLTAIFTGRYPAPDGWLDFV
jgi:branched-chain amino acid aminotransferase